MLLETLFVALWANAVWLLDALAELWFDGQLCFHWCFGGVVLTLHFYFFYFYFFFSVYFRVHYFSSFFFFYVVGFRDADLSAFVSSL